MSAPLEEVLSRLLASDNKIIEEATKELRVIIKKPDSIVLLFQTLSSQRLEVRQYAAVLLRRKILKSLSWNSLASDVKEGIKQGVLDIFKQESISVCKKAESHLIASIGRHEVPPSHWPALFIFIEELIKSSEVSNIESGMLLLCSLSSCLRHKLKPHLPSLLFISNHALDNPHGNHLIASYSIKVLTNILQAVDSTNQSGYQATVPKVISVIKQIIPIDQNLAGECLDYFDQLLSYEVSIVTNHLRDVMTFFVEISKDKSLEGPLRCKAMTLISEAISKKKKVIIKMNFVIPLINEMFAIVSEPRCHGDKDGCHEEEEEEDEDDPTTFALQVFDTMALNLPPEKYIFPLLKAIEPAFLSEKTKERCAAYLVVAMSTDGCSENIKSKHLKKLLKQVYVGMSDGDEHVRSAALFTLGEFSEYLQPEISKYSKEFFPLLFECLRKTPLDAEHVKGDVYRTYYALESFCENMGKEILPYMSELVSFLLSSIQVSPSKEIKMHSISALSSLATAAGDDILPHLPRILEILKVFLKQTNDPEELKVQTEAIDTLSSLTREAGPSFSPLTSESLNLALSLINIATDPDLKASIYGLLGSCCSVLKLDFSPHLSNLVPLLLAALSSNEGIVAHYDDDDIKHITEIFDEEENNKNKNNNNNNNNESIDITEEEEDEEEDEDEFHNVKSVGLQNSYMEEKLEALNCIGEFSKHTGPHFLPFLETSFKESFDLINHLFPEIKRSAVLCSSHLCSASHKLLGIAGAADVSKVTDMVKATVGEYLTLVREEEEREVIITVFEALNEMVRDIGSPFLNYVGSVDVIYSVVKDVVKKKLKCQSVEYDDDDEDEAEYDTLLMESAGDLVPSLAKIAPSNDFNQFFSSIIPDLIKKFKKTDSPAEKSFVVGTFSETLHELGSKGVTFVSKAYPILTQGAHDEDEEVRSNAVYGLGVLASMGGQSIQTHLNEIMKILSDILSKETDQRVIDNICGAVARMITSFPEAVPISQVLPIVLKYMPLKEDLEENSTVLQCLHFLISTKNQQIFPMLLDITILLGNLVTSKIKPEQITMVKELIKQIYVLSPEIFNSIPPEQTEAVKNLEECLKMN